VGVPSGTGYLLGSITRAGAGMGELPYPCAITGNLTGKIFSSGCGYGIEVPVGYVPVAIFRIEMYLEATLWTKEAHAWLVSFLRI
jgi:hypothetical protein